jgi:hypothetical protein
MSTIFVCEKGFQTNVPTACKRDAVLQRQQLTQALEYFVVHLALAELRAPHSPIMSALFGEVLELEKANKIKLW